MIVWMIYLKIGICYSKKKISYWVPNLCILSVVVTIPLLTIVEHFWSRMSRWYRIIFFGYVFSFLLLYWVSSVNFFLFLFNMNAQLFYNHTTNMCNQTFFIVENKIVVLVTMKYGLLFRICLFLIVVSKNYLKHVWII